MPTDDKEIRDIPNIRKAVEYALVLMASDIADCPAEGWNEKFGRPRHAALMALYESLPEDDE